MSGAEFITPRDMPAPSGYSHVAAIRASQLVWTSGQVAIDSSGTVVGRGDWEVQTRTVMHHLTHALRAASASWEDVFKLTIYVVDLVELATIRKVRDEFIDVNRPQPARSSRSLG